MVEVSSVVLIVAREREREKCESVCVSERGSDRERGGERERERATAFIGGSVYVVLSSHDDFRPSDKQVCGFFLGGRELISAETLLGN